MIKVKLKEEKKIKMVRHRLAMWSGVSYCLRSQHKWLKAETFSFPKWLTCEGLTKLKKIKVLTIKQ